MRTRRQDYSWPRYNSQDYRSDEEECDHCSSQASRSSYGSFGNSFSQSQSSQGSYIYSTPPSRSSDGYGANDRCKRHRRGDNEPYTEEVVSYKRRKPRT